MGYVSDAQRKAVHASRADGGKGNPNKMLSPLDFGAIGAIGSMFGSMGSNPSINALTNANALAAQQAAASQVNAGAQAAAQPVGSGMIGDMSQNVMDASMPTFDPAAQLAGMGVFGARSARNRSLFPSAIMAHKDEQVKAKKDRIEEIRADYEEERKEGDFYEDEEYSKLMQELKEIEKEHKKQ